MNGSHEELNRDLDARLASDLWKNNFEEVCQLVIRLQKSHQATQDSLAINLKNADAVKEWLDSIGFKPFIEARARHQSEQQRIIESGSVGLEAIHVELRSEIQTLSSSVADLTSALDANAYKSSNSNRAQGVSEVFLELERQIAHVDRLTKSGTELKTNTANCLSAYRTDQDLVDDCVGSIRKAQNSL